MTFLLAHDEETVRVLMRPSIEENATDFVKETIRRTVKQLVAAGNEEYDWIGVFCELDTRDGELFLQWLGRQLGAPSKTDIRKKRKKLKR